MAKKEKGASGDVTHHVLYIKHHETAELHPLASREEGDENIDDDFLSLKVQHLNIARAAGAPRPTFSVTREVGGHPIEAA